MERPLRYLLRPSLIANAAECRRRGFPDLHEHPNYRKMPANVRFPIVFAHPLSHYQGSVRVILVRCLVMWRERGLAWWVDVTPDRYRRLPRIMADDWEYRL